MAEGDSVAILARRLRTALDGRVVASGEIRGGRAAGASLAGRTILEHLTHGKHLLTRFDDRTSLHTHLRMDGSWTITGAGRAVPPRVQRDVRLRMRIETGQTAWGVRIPIVELLATRDEHRVVGHLGPDPLRHDWDPSEAVRRMRERPQREVIAALLDQRVVAGFGNLWANELCFLLGAWPWSPVDSVDVPRLIETGARCLTSSATIPGMLQITTGRSRRDERHWVAGRAGRACLRCATTIRVRAAVPGDPERRRTWWCPVCQPAG